MGKAVSVQERNEGENAPLLSDSYFYAPFFFATEASNDEQFPFPSHTGKTTAITRKRRYPGKLNNDVMELASFAEYPIVNTASVFEMNDDVEFPHQNEPRGMVFLKDFMREESSFIAERKRRTTAS
uniref:Uncharacterized protein n=1 Tax=Angiostrongylus cantonensis TaxID=6313 RepID=A0A0K0D9Q3_ANGCA